MNMSLRDQLLAAGLINQKQARDAERQQQHQQRGQHQQRAQQAKRQRAPSASPSGATARNEPEHAKAAEAAGQAVPAPATPDRVAPAGAASAHGNPGQPSAFRAIGGANASAQSAKVARDLALNRQRHEKAEKKARAAQIKQLIEQNRVPRAQTDERYNFVDGSSVRCIAVDATVRGRLMRGEFVIVRLEGRYEVVTAAVAERIRERDERAVVEAPKAAPGEPQDEAYRDHPVPDDLRW